MSNQIIGTEEIEMQKLKGEINLTATDIVVNESPALKKKNSLFKMQLE